MVAGIPTANTFAFHLSPKLTGNYLMSFSTMFILSKAIMLPLRLLVLVFHKRIH